MASKEAGGAWQVLREHGKQLVSVLEAWDDEKAGRVRRHDFGRAAQALGALGIANRIPSEVELDSMFAVMTAGQEELEIASLLRPLEPRSFEVFEEEPADPDDCFEQLAARCQACGAEPAEGKKLLVCQRCKRIRYCSRPCQLSGWRGGHKESCGKCIPTPSKVTHGSAQLVAAVLREFGAAHGGLAHTCMSRLGALALDRDGHELNLRGMIDAPGGVEGIVRCMGTYADSREVTLPGYMLLCALCQTAREGAVAVSQAGGLTPLIATFKLSVDDRHILRSGISAMRCMAATGPTAKQQLVDGQGVFGLVWAMREYQEDVPLLTEAIGALSSIAHRGGVDIRKYVIFNSGVEGVVTCLRKHVDGEGRHERLAECGMLALRNFIAGDNANVICGSAVDVAHTMTAAMTKYLGIEAVVDCMMYHQANEMIQEDGAAVLANVGSVDLGAKRQHEVTSGSDIADTQATLNITDALIPICKAIRRFPQLGSPRHALHVITANLGSPKEALEAGAELDWLPDALQWDKGPDEKL